MSVRRADNLNLSPEQARIARIRAQHLSQKARVDDLVEVVRSIGGVNAQSGPAMMLALRARVEGLRTADVRKAIEDRALARTWAMRGTIHLIDSGDLGRMVALLGPVILKKGARRRLELGLDEEVVARGMAVIRSTLAGREPMSRGDLTEALIDQGVDIERKSQGPYHLIAYAALKGLICIGPDSPKGEQTYMLANQPDGDTGPLDRNDALAGLALRYLRGYGPASPGDFSAWSGLPMADARKGWKLAEDRETLLEMKVEGRTLWLPEAQYRPEANAGVTDTVVNLLPAFDPLVLGYSDRECIVPEKYRKEVYHGGQTVPVVLVDGRAAGVWRYQRRGNKLNITVALLEPVMNTIRTLIEEEGEDIGRFWELRTSLSYRS